MLAHHATGRESACYVSSSLQCNPIIGRQLSPSFLSAPRSPCLSPSLSLSLRHFSTAKILSYRGSVTESGYKTADLFVLELPRTDDVTTDNLPSSSFFCLLHHQDKHHPPIGGGEADREINTVEWHTDNRKRRRYHPNDNHKIILVSVGIVFLEIETRQERGSTHESLVQIDSRRRKMHGRPRLPLPTRNVINCTASSCLTGACFPPLR